MKVVLVQLSDIHIDDETNNSILTKTDEISRAVYPYLPGADHIVLIVSGDIAYSGTQSQYKLAQTFLQEIVEKLSAEAGRKVGVFVVPGNHDCDFQNESKSRSNNVQYLQSNGVSAIDDSVINVCTEIQKNFFQFQKSIEGKDAHRTDRLWHEYRVPGRDCNVVIEGMNIAWVSKLREEPGRMLFPFERYQNKQRNPEDLHILVMHHPVNWFNQNIYAGYRRFLRDRATMVISGHEHLAGVTEINDIDAGSSVNIEGCVLQEHKGNLTSTGFNVIAIDTANVRYQAHRLEYQAGAYSTREEGAWLDYRPLPQKAELVGKLKKNHLEKLNDPGAYLFTPGRDSMALSDIYVYPDLVPANQLTSKVRQLINSSTLQISDELRCGVLVSGDERSGRSSLLYQLYVSHHAQGLFPVLIDGSKIDSTHEKDIDQLIRQSVAAQYEATTAKGFASTSRFQKVLLLDNFDESGIVDKVGRAKVLELFKQRFEYVVATVSSTFEMQEAVDANTAELLKEFKHFHIQPFGNVKRSQLIKRWLSLGADNSLDERDFIGKYHEAERLLTGVMDKSLIPHSPLFLLTLLHSVEAGRSNELQNSALGHYYLVLLGTALQGAGVRPEKLDDYIQYCTYLSWRFHQSEGTLLSRTELRAFNDDFSNEWMTTDFDKYLTVLLEARVLREVGQDYEIRYPYIYFYLKGRYLSMHLDDPEILKYVSECCDHLYVRENANTMLFLAHHVSNNSVIEQIARVLGKLFGDKAPVRFDDDVGNVNNFIFESPKLVFESSHSPTELRDEIAEEADKREHHDGLMEKREQGADLSLQSQIVMLAKTSEILGQLLKDQYARIPRTKKRELVGKIFDGNMRALRSFFDTIVNSSESLFNGVQEALKSRKKEITDTQGQAMTRRIVSVAIEMVTFALVIKAAQNATSPDLSEDVESFVDGNKHLSNRIIELATLLDSASDFPRKKLESVYKDCKTNLIALRIVENLVFHRLYMFKTSTADMRWLHDKLGIPIKFQQTVSFGRQETQLA
ncbi:metallophosphoesterase [Dyella terrae]|uniref:metallophosphoesterase n=1 Tax=Dyella terrae TaxID=522259 RepID=UPI001EFC7EDF|nr:metallophosphoesterase [Dyella terrae]ULU23195.1 NACHT domain-containing protein [Dyella terrae]